VFEKHYHLSPHGLKDRRIWNPTLDLAASVPMLSGEFEGEGDCVHKHQIAFETHV
jgi:hypothetical protein